ncbi:F-box only protein 2 isoform X3 [Megalobrama amblycephala]|uniref:F-box only protein 2 isoform X3 n=1 Tax=Megalobrama amblycephala TaxID=75352 RepID=UPI0020145AA9|nr:F-box only protein 2 isoform X3 [Megalobrama amblycephala]
MEATSGGPRTCRGTADTFTVMTQSLNTSAPLLMSISVHCSRPCLKRQLIDLLAEGYDPEHLDIVQPGVNVEDWYCGRTDCGCIYKLTVSLLDEGQEIITEFKPDEVTLDPDCDDCSWRKVSHTFTDYGPGLRFISFEHGGQDTKYWQGWFGVRVTGSSVTVDL